MANYEIQIFKNKDYLNTFILELEVKRYPKHTWYLRNLSVRALVINEHFNIKPKSNFNMFNINEKVTHVMQRHHIITIFLENNYTIRLRNLSIEQY
jgi:hypothetical protein